MVGSSYGSSQSVVPTLYNICLAGKYGVGKTTIFKLVLNDNTCNCSDTGVAEFKYTVSGFNSIIKLVDTGGIERYSLSMGNYYRRSGCVIFVYDVTDLDSLHWIKKEFDTIMQKGYCDTDTKYVILRNKIDVARSEVMVTKEDENEYLKNHFGTSICNVFETSGEEDIRITKFFREDLIEILKGVDPVAPERHIFKNRYEKESCCN